MRSGGGFWRVRPVLGIVLAAVVCGAAGCGPSEPFDLLPVSGSVVCQDGSLDSATRIQVLFDPQVEPIDPKTYPLPGMAEVNKADGTFSEATSHKYGDGLTVGRHKVRVFCYDKDNVSSELAVEPAEIEVAPGNTELKFTVKGKRR
jgi:hypothetical protein